MTQYPSQIATLPTHAPGEVLTARKLNDIQYEIMATEGTLGNNPSGSKTDVTARLNWLDGLIYKTRGDYNYYVNYWAVSYSTVSTSTLLDLTTLPGSTLPSTARAVNMRIAVRDSAAFGSDWYYWACGPDATYWYSALSMTFGADRFQSINATVPCTNGTVYYRVKASGTNTLDLYLEVWGYWEAP